MIEHVRPLKNRQVARKILRPFRYADCVAVLRHRFIFVYAENSIAAPLEILLVKVWPFKSIVNFLVTLIAFTLVASFSRVSAAVVSAAVAAVSAAENSV